MAAVGMSGEEEGMTVSSYSVSELWQRLPVHLVKDIFGYFSLHDIGQKPRYEYTRKKSAYRSAFKSFMCIFQGVARLEVVAVKFGLFQPRYPLH